MKILFDKGTPRGPAKFLAGHSIEEARAHGWEELENGQLIEAAEQAGFDLIVTTDKNIRYQQNLKSRKIAIVVLKHSQWPMVKLVAENTITAVNAATEGSFVEVDVRLKNSPRSHQKTHTLLAFVTGASARMCVFGLQRILKQMGPRSTKGPSRPIGLWTVSVETLKVIRPIHVSGLSRINVLQCRKRCTGQQKGLPVSALRSI